MIYRIPNILFILSILSTSLNQKAQPMPEVSSFEHDTIYRQTVEAVRFWVISHYLAHGNVPDVSVMFVYPNGPDASLDWGNPAGPDDPRLQPLRRKRIRVTFQVESLNH